MSHQSRKILFLLFVPFFLGIGHSVFSQKQRIQQVDQLLSSIYKKDAPGVSVLISENGNTLYNRYLGLSNLEYQIPINGSSKFPIGSITKQFTATAILLLQEQGKLKISDYIANYLPEFDLEKHPVKITHLLTHTSGIASDNAKKEIRKGLRNNINPEEILDIIKRESLLFAPGSRYDYSNNGYIILGLLIEKISGLSYAEFLQKHIFDPLKMADTQVGFYQDIVLNRVSGYAEEEGQIINASYHASSFSAGAIISTPSDIKVWTQALFSFQIINEASISQILQNYMLNDGSKTNIGFGWELNKVKASICYEHSGFEPGYKSVSMYLPKENIHIVVMQNTEVLSPVTLAINLASIMLDTPYPTPSESISLSKNELQKFLGVYALENNVERIVGLDRKGNLFIKAQGGIAQQLYILNANTLFYDQGYRQLHFGEDSAIGFKKITYQNRINKILGTKKTNQIPESNTVQQLDVAQLEAYVGVYKAEPFTMFITLENNKLYAQPEGSDKLELLPKGGHQFFIKEIGAEIEFDADGGMEIKKMNILLEGNKMVAIKE